MFAYREGKDGKAVQEPDWRWLTTMRREQKRHYRIERKTQSRFWAFEALTGKPSGGRLTVKSGEGWSDVGLTSKSKSSLAATRVQRERKVGREEAALGRGRFCLNQQPTVTGHQLITGHMVTVCDCFTVSMSQ